MIEAANLTKRFDEIVAVDHINAKIRTDMYLASSEPTGLEKVPF